MEVSELCRAYGPEGWRARSAAHLFSSDESLRWFLRRHLDTLIRRGAVVQVAGRLLVHPPTMGRIVIDLFRLDALGDRRRDQLKLNHPTRRSGLGEASSTRGRWRLRPQVKTSAVVRGAASAARGSHGKGGAPQKRPVLTLKRRAER